MKRLIDPEVAAAAKTLHARFCEGCTNASCAAALASDIQELCEYLATGHDEADWQDEDPVGGPGQ